MHNSQQQSRSAHRRCSRSAPTSSSRSHFTFVEEEVVVRCQPAVRVRHKYLGLGTPQGGRGDPGQVQLMTGCCNLVFSSPQLPACSSDCCKAFPKEFLLPVLRSHMLPHGGRGGAGPGSSLAGAQHRGLPTSPSLSFLHDQYRLLLAWPTHL